MKTNNQSKQSILTKLFYGILFFLTALPMVRAEAPTPVDQLTGLAKGVGALFVGDFQTFIAGLFGAVTVLAIFFIVWQLFKFIFENTVFKIAGDEEKASSYANWVGIGFGLLAIVIPQIYLFIYGFVGGTGMLIFVILVFLFAIWKFILSQKVGIKHTSANLSKAEARKYEADKYKEKARHAVDIQKDQSAQEMKLINRERHLVSEAEHIIDNDITIAKSAQDNIDAMKELFARLGAVGLSSPQAEQIKKQLSAQAAGLSTYIKRDVEDVSKIRSLMSKYSKLVLRGIRIEQTEATTANDLIAKYQKAHAANANVNTAVANHEKEIRDLVSKAVQMDKRRLNILQKLKAVETQKVNLEGRIQDKLKELSSSLSANQVSEANNHLIELEQELNTVIKDDSFVKQGIADLRLIEGRIQTLDNQIRTIEKKIIADLA